MTDEELKKGVLSLLDVRNVNFVVSRNTLKMTFFSFFISDLPILLSRLW